MRLKIFRVSRRLFKVAAYTILAVLLFFALHWVFTYEEHTVHESSSSSTSTRNSSVNMKDLSLLSTSTRNSSVNMKDLSLLSNITYDYIFRDKDPCFVWRELRKVIVPTVWWQQHCEFESDWMTLDYKCKDKQMMGNWAVCFDYDLIPNKSCLVYSFGIDNDFRFDDAMASVGCTVYSFDPSMNVMDHKHAERVFFKNVGISGHDNDSFVPRIDYYVSHPTTWRVRCLASIMKELGHELGSLTVLKLDIETNEWDVLSDLLKSNILPTIPQVLVEWHLFPDAPPHSRLANILDDYFHFRSLGFQKFTIPETMDSHTIEELRTLTEIAYVNKKYLHH